MAPHQLQRHQEMASSSSSTTHTKYFTVPGSSLQGAGTGSDQHGSHSIQKAAKRQRAACKLSAFFPDQDRTHAGHGTSHAMQGCSSWNVQSWGVISAELLTLFSCAEEDIQGWECSRQDSPTRVKMQHQGLSYSSKPPHGFLARTH